MASASCTALAPTPPESGFTSMMTRLSATWVVNAGASTVASGDASGEDAAVARVSLMPPERPAPDDVPASVALCADLLLQLFRRRGGAGLGRVARLVGGGSRGFRGLVGDLGGLALDGRHARRDPTVHGGAALGQRLLLDAEDGGQDAEDRQQGDDDPDDRIAAAPAFGPRPYRAVLAVIRHANRFRKTHTKPPSRLVKIAGARPPRDRRQA